MSVIYKVITSVRQPEIYCTENAGSFFAVYR